MLYNLLVLLAISILLCSCAVFKAPVFESLDQFELNDLTPDHTSLDLSLVISNPNWYAITVKSLDVKVMDLNDDKLSNIVMSQPLKVEKHSSDTVYFDIMLDTRQVTKLISHSSQKVDFVVNADARVKVFGISKRVRISQPQSINFTQILEQLISSIPSDIQIPTYVADKKRRIVISNAPPKSAAIKMDIFKVLKTSITDVGIKETELTVRFLMLNPYGLSFTFRDFPAEIWINDKFAGRGRLDAPLVFDENIYQAEGKLVFNLNNFNSILLASNALMKKDIAYRVNGTLEADGFGTTISKLFSFHGNVEIGKKDK